MPTFSALGPLSTLCGRLSVGKCDPELCVAGWCGHVSDLFSRRMVPLAIMPFARSGSRPIARTPECWVEVGFPDPAVSTGFVHQLLFALSNIVSAGSRPRMFRHAVDGSR
jgi:hypothetical protein